MIRADAKMLIVHWRRCTADFQCLSFIFLHCKLSFIVSLQWQTNKLDDQFKFNKVTHRNVELNSSPDEYTQYILNKWNVSYREFWVNGICFWLKIPTSPSIEWHQTWDRPKLLAWVLYWDQIIIYLDHQYVLKPNDDSKANLYSCWVFFSLCRYNH